MVHCPLEVRLMKDFVNHYNVLVKSIYNSDLRNHGNGTEQQTFIIIFPLNIHL